MEGWSDYFTVLHTEHQSTCSICGFTEMSREEPLEVKKQRIAQQKNRKHKQLLDQLDKLNTELDED